MGKRKKIRVYRDKPRLRVTIPLYTNSFWGTFQGDDRCLFSWLEDNININEQWAVYEIQNCAHCMCFNGWLITFELETHENNMLGKLLYYLDKRLKQSKVEVHEEITALYHAA